MEQKFENEFQKWLTQTALAPRHLQIKFSGYNFGNPARYRLNIYISSKSSRSRTPVHLYSSVTNNRVRKKQKCGAMD
jgi:hypothetical protein